MHPETAKETHPEEKGVFIRLPKFTLPSLQSGILFLLILVGALQTAQLFALDKKIASAKINTTGSPSVAAPAASNPGTSALPEMVGGC